MVAHKYKRTRTFLYIYSSCFITYLRCALCWLILRYYVPTLTKRTKLYCVSIWRIVLWFNAKSTNKLIPTKTFKRFFLLVSFGIAHRRDSSMHLLQAYCSSIVYSNIAVTYLIVVILFVELSLTFRGLFFEILPVEICWMFVVFVIIPHLVWSHWNSKMKLRRFWKNFKVLLIWVWVFRWHNNCGSNHNFLWNVMILP